MRVRPITPAITGGALAAVLIASPAIAATTQGAEEGPAPDRQATRPVGECDGDRDGDGERRGPGAPGRSDTAPRGDRDGAAREMRGPRTGMGGAAGLADVPSGTLTEAQEATLIAMAEEEKLARDLYAAFAETHAAPVFSRIADAEARHLEAVRVLLGRYGLDDPTADLPAGTFATKAAQESHDARLADGSSSLEAAYAVGRAVETADISDLDAALAGITAPDVQRVYERLLAASQHHLGAFEG